MGLFLRSVADMRARMGLEKGPIMPWYLPASGLQWQDRSGYESSARCINLECFGDTNQKQLP